VLSNSMEAVMAALFLDGGLEPVRAFARRWVMGEAADQLAQELRSGAALATSSRRSRNNYRLRGPELPSIGSRVKAAQTTAKRFLGVEVRCSKRKRVKPGKPLARGMGSTPRSQAGTGMRRGGERWCRLAAAAAKPAPPSRLGPSCSGLPFLCSPCRGPVACPAHPLALRNLDQKALAWSGPLSLLSR